MEPHYIYSPFFVAFAILRLLVNLTFFIKTKFKLCRYSILWLLPLFAFTVDAMFILLLATRKTGFEEQAGELVGLLVNDNLMTFWFKWSYMTIFWNMLDQTISVSQVIKYTCSRNYSLIACLAILAVATFRNDKVPVEIINDDALAVSICIGATIGFLIVAWNSAAGKQLSFLIFGCVFTQLPLSSAYMRLIWPYFYKYLFTSAPVPHHFIHKVDHIILYGVVLVEAISASRAILGTYHKKLLWPNFKGFGRPRGIEAV